MYEKKRDGESPAVEHETGKKESREPTRALDLRRNRMARRLDKIEKEMGYCEIKLEKEGRLQKQVAFLSADLDSLDRLIEEHSRAGLERGGRARSSRQSFLAVGLMDVLEEEREIISREIEEITTRLESYTGFGPKRTHLEEEKRTALKDLSPTHSSKMRRANESFKKVERQWNVLSEDLINLDEGIFFLERNLDYLRSCRTFLISAKGNFDIEGWLSGGYLSDLFRHSTIGRAKEMAHGADRNLKSAQKELVCISSLKIRYEPFRFVLEPLLEGLYEDVLMEGKLERSLQVVEAALAGNLKLVEQIKSKRDQWGSKLDELEKQRATMFTRLESGRKGWVAG